MSSVAQDKIHEQEEYHPQRVKDKEVFWGTVERKSKGNLNDAQKCNCSSGPLVDGDSKGAEFCYVSHKSSTDQLENEEYQNGNANSVVRVCQISLRANGEETQHKNSQKHQAREDHELCVVNDSEAWFSRVKSRHHDRYWDKKQEYESAHYAVRQDNSVVLRKRSKSVSHS